MRKEQRRFDMNKDKPKIGFIIDPSKTEEFLKFDKETPKCAERAIERVEAKLKALRARREAKKCTSTK